MEFRKKTTMVECFCVSLILIFIFFTMFYSDLTITLQFSLTLIDSLFDGKYASFYNNALATGVAPEGAVYDLGIYIVFAIWGLPIWIANKMFNVSALSIGSLLWFRLLLVILALVCVEKIEEIAEEINIDRHLAGKLFLFSPLLIFPVFIIAQYDIIPLFFMLNGVLYAIREDKKKSLINFAISFTMKPHALITFLVVLLVKEKNIFRIMKTGMLSVIPLLLCKGIYILNPINSASNNIFLSSMINKLFDVTVDVGNGKISIFSLILCIICIAAYKARGKNDKVIEGRWTIWLLFLTWIDFCVFTPSYPYWIIYLAPFLILVTLYSTSDIDFVLLMELIGSVGLIIIMVLKYPWVFGGANTFNYLLLKFGTLNREIHSVYDVLCLTKISVLNPVIYAITIVTFGSIAYFGYPKIDKEEENKSNISCVNKWHWIGRIVLLYCWCLLCVLLLIVG